VRERAVLFGSHRGLAGIVTEPDTSGQRPRRAVILSNVGMHSRIGPFRIWVDFARRLARQGYYVLRFDLSGTGDSELRAGTLRDQELVDLDMAEASSWLADKLGIEQFVLVGLCSGVAGGHAMAARDPRVIAAIFIDGYAYRTRGFYFRRYAIRYLQPERWARFARRRIAQFRHGPQAQDDSLQAAPRFYTGLTPPLAQFRADIRQMTDRGIPLLFIYTGEVQEWFNGRGQLFEMLGARFPRRGITVEYRGTADHLFESLGEREQLLQRMCGWIQSLDKPGS
jgi:pimeloyl-ACP methyl ester carboxylesterase